MAHYINKIMNVTITNKKELIDSFTLAIEEAIIDKDEAQFIALVKRYAEVSDWPKPITNKSKKAIPDETQSK